MNSTTLYENQSTKVNRLLISIEVIAAVSVICALCFCYLRHYYIMKRNQEIIEKAIDYQENRFLYHLEGQCHSTSTIATTVSKLPPCYSPPDSNKNLPSDVISRLDYLLFLNQCCCSKYHSSLPSSTVVLPRYTQLNK